MRLARGWPGGWRLREQSRMTAWRAGSGAHWLTVDGRAWTPTDTSVAGERTPGEWVDWETRDHAFSVPQRAPLTLQTHDWPKYGSFGGTKLYREWRIADSTAVHVLDSGAPGLHRILSTLAT